MLEGLIVKGISGFYYVKTNNNETLYECKARGKFRKDNIVPMVGDLVVIETMPNDKGIVEQILPRKNQLLRPIVSNVDQVIIVFSIIDPCLNTDLLNKILILAEEQKIESIICINKIDLDKDNMYDDFEKIYKNAGYTVINTSTFTKKGIDNLTQLLKDKVTVFAGPSGVGKSSLLNNIQNSIIMQTSEISEKIKRGKHTTRHAELIALDKGGYIIDTPGFSSLELAHIDKDDLQYYYREFAPYIDNCKFNSCNHIKQSSCAVQQQVANGNIDKVRYENYIEMYNTLTQNNIKKYKK